MTVAQTLEVVHGLMNNVRVVMNVLVLDGKASTECIRRVLGTMQQMATRCKKTPKIGSALQIRRKTTTSGAKPIEMEPPHGFSEDPSLMSGTQRFPFCGSTENRVLGRAFSFLQASDDSTASARRD